MTPSPPEPRVLTDADVAAMLADVMAEVVWERMWPTEPRPLPCPSAMAMYAHQPFLLRAMCRESMRN